MAVAEGAYGTLASRVQSLICVERNTLRRKRLTHIKLPARTQLRDEAGGAICMAFGSFGCHQPDGQPLPLGRQQLQGVQRREKPTRPVTRRAKFQEFDPNVPNLEEVLEEDASNGATTTAVADPDELRDDRVLPDSLEDAVLKSSKATALYCHSGGSRAIVELLIPELDNLMDTGAQEQLWTCARIFIEALQVELGNQQIKAIFPDAGCAAMLKHRWEGSTFTFGSLNDRVPIGPEDEVVVLVAPDHQLLKVVKRIGKDLTENDGIPVPLIMWNPRLVSGDVGVGYNVRQLREEFLSTFTVAYSLRPTSDGAIFKAFPGPWQVFLDDPNRNGRYLLISEQNDRPTPDDMDEIALEQSDEEQSVVAQAATIFNSLQRFMKALSR